jgi:beta-lactamase regulating signal transducer with metallopeptidase domain
VETLLHAGLSNALSASFLALLVACLARPLARRPAVLHSLWLLVLLKLVTPPLYQVPVPLPGKRAALVDTQAEGALVVEIAESEPSSVPTRIEEPWSASSLWNRLDVDWSRLIATIWLAGSAVSIVVAARRIVRFQRVLDDAQPACEEIQQWVDELAMNLGVLRPPSVWWTGAKVSPMLWALGRVPRLIIPLDLWKSLDARQRSTLVAHELAHLRRGDHRVRLFELIVTTLYWWHPVAWWARRALRDVEEQCCDAWVVWTFPDAAKSYAETLLETLDFLNQSDQPEPLLASGFGKVHHLRRRLTMIMSGNTPRLVSVKGALGSLAVAALLLPVGPTWAQKPADNPKEDTVVETVIVGDPDKVGSGVALGDSSIAIVSDSSESADPNTNVNVTVKTDDQPAVVVSGSLEQAISALKDQIKVIREKSPLSDSDRRRAEALERALEQINKVARQVKAIDLGAAKGKAKAENRRVVIRNLDLNKMHVIANPHALVAQKAEAEKRLAEAQERIRVVTRMSDAEQELAVKAKQAAVEKALAAVEQARSRVNQLTKELNQKRQELSHANAELSRLKHVEARVVIAPKEAKAGAPGGSHAGSGSASAAGSAAVVAPKLSDSDRQRLADLEKKLDRLLDEVASLKKLRRQ